MAREKGMGNLQREKGGRWTARIGVDGRRIARSARTRNKAAAEKLLERMLAPLGRGAGAVPLSEAWSAYERSPGRREQSAATLASKRVIWVRFAEWLDAVHPEITAVEGLTAEAAAEYVRVFRIGRAAGTVNNTVCTLREIWRCVAGRGNGREGELVGGGVGELGRVGVGAGDPWAGVRLLPDDSHARRSFELEELERIMAAAGRAGREWRMLFAVGMHTGLRLGDCCLLSWKEADLERGLIQVVPRKTKRFAGGRPVTIPIHPALAVLLAEAAASSGNQSPDQTGNRANEQGEGYAMPQLAGWYLHERWRVSKGLGEIFAEAGIRTSVTLAGRARATPDATFHSLRHTFVSFAANAGVPLPVVGAIVGHTSTAMTRHYYHESEDALRRAVAAVPEIGGEPESGESDTPQGKIPPPILPRQAQSSIDATQHGATGQDPSKRLKRLAKCLKQGLITQDEYAAQRAAIIASI